MSELLVTRTVHINAHRSPVWDAITVPELITEWFGNTADVELTVGAAGKLGWDDFGEFRIVAEEVDEPNVSAFRWARETNTDPRPGNSTLVRFVLADKDGGTELTVRETGWEEFEGDIDAAMKDNTGGWVSELDELVAFLDKQDSV